MTKSAVAKGNPTKSFAGSLWGPRAIALAFCVAVALSAAGGCEGGAGPDGPRDPASPRADPLSSAAPQAEMLPTPVYFTVSPDMRMCPSARCGGFWVKAVNRRTTACADGTSAEACYVAAIDWRAMGGDPGISAATVVVKGSLRLQTYAGIGDLGVLVARDAWGSATALSPAGITYRLSDSGIVCVAAPCFNVDAEALNLGLGLKLSGYDLSKVGATDEQLKLAGLAYRKGRLLASGSIVPVASMTRPGSELVASQFFLPARWWCSSDADCGASERCNAAEICLPPPWCGEGAACPTVCTGYCVPQKP